jgi:hypothetical protein
VNLLHLYLHVLAQFGISLILQVAVWRISRRPAGQVPMSILWLFLLFGAGPVVDYFVCGNLDQLVLGLALGGFYLMSFPAAAAQSPTILVVDMLSRRGPMSEAELLQELNLSVDLVNDRIADMKADGLAGSKDGQLKIRTTGVILGNCFWLYRRLLGLPIGDG